MKKFPKHELETMQARFMIVCAICFLIQIDIGILPTKSFDQALRFSHMNNFAKEYFPVIFY